MLRRALASGLVLAACLLAGSVPGAQADTCLEGMRCGAVSVPADWNGKLPGRLDLRYRVTEGDGPLFLLLGGGPGQATYELAEAYATRVPEVVPGYRFATFDQRGTGATAIRCPRLQRLRLTDFTIRPRAAVRRCGRSLGARRSLYSTASTVRDIEAVRRELGADQMILMGISYGTYVAMRYARRHPDRVQRLILDSVVPQENVDPFLRVHMRRSSRVLRSICRLADCGFKSDPATDLRRLVGKPARRVKVPGRARRIRVDGPALLDWLTTAASFAQNHLADLALGIHRASRGNYRKLAGVGEDLMEMADPPPAELVSWGLHAATLCSDARLPFPIRSASRARRWQALSRKSGSIPARSFWPFDRRTARRNGLLQTCLDWPRTRVAPAPRPGRLKPPTLFLAGQFDLSTPVEYARHELKRAPRGRLVVAPTAGHSIGFRVPCASRAIGQFIAGELGRNPCRNGLD